MSTEDIGKMLGCSSTPILSRLKDAGIYNPKKIREKRKERYLRKRKTRRGKGEAGACLQPSKQFTITWNGNAVLGINGKRRPDTFLDI